MQKKFRCSTIDDVGFCVVEGVIWGWNENIICGEGGCTNPDFYRSSNILKQVPMGNAQLFHPQGKFEMLNLNMVIKVSDWKKIKTKVKDLMISKWV